MNIIKKKTITNWSEYNKSLVKRGACSVWLNSDTVDNWYNKKPRKGRGMRNIYSDNTIKVMMIVSELYSLPYRQTEGFIKDSFAKQGINLKVPTYSVLSKRGSKLDIEVHLNKIRELKSIGENINLVMDGTGIKVYGENEWKVRIHGQAVRRKWLKLHVAIDRDSRQAVSMSVTGSSTHDGEEFHRLLEGAKSHGYMIEKCYADGAYSWNEVFEKLYSDGIKAVIPLPENAVMEGEDSNEVVRVTRARDKMLLEQYEARGVVQWKKTSDYHQRSLIENHFSRLKLIFGERLRHKISSIRKLRLQIRVEILNYFAAMGLPKYNYE